MVDQNGAREGQEGAWVDEVIILTGNELQGLGKDRPGGLAGAPLVDREGVVLGHVDRVIDSGPDGLSEAYVAPTETVYERIGEERGGNPLGFPAEEVEVASDGRLRIPVTLDELFERNHERGGRPRDVGVREELGI